MAVKTVVILAAGKGTRVAQITNGKNKCLIGLGFKTAAEHILSHFTHEDRIIFVLNKDDSNTEQYVRSKTDFNITFVYTDRQGGPGDSLSAARDILDKDPFILWYCDTILDEQLPADFSNDFIICSTQYQENYSKYMIVPENEIITDKSVNELREDNLFYIGLSYIKDVTAFWKFYDDHPEEFKKLCDIAYVNSTKSFNKFITDKWYDVGNISSYNVAKSAFNSYGK